MRLGLIVVVAAGVVALGSGCSSDHVSDRYGVMHGGLAAYCTATVKGKGVKDVETDYIPRVVRCENGAAPLEALKAQAVAARSYLYYKLNTSGSIADGTSDQVYTCSAQPQAIHYQAAEETVGEVLRYKGTQVAAFYVAGAVPSTANCVAKAGDNDYSNTEKWVTYNQGKSGDNLTQTKLGWVNKGNHANRGCKSQNGASCLAKKGWGYIDILEFYYGSDIVHVTAEGSCVQPSCDCDPGQTQEKACGNCGTKKRTCSSDCGWGAWGQCKGSGPCAPGDSESTPCGNCGTQSRVCTGQCKWPSWGGCSGEGVCVPGQVEQLACGNCGLQERLCSGGCSWGFQSDCNEDSAAGTPCKAPGEGTCAIGVFKCLSGTIACVAQGEPSQELCDGLDNDCNGLVDDGATQVANPAPAMAAALATADAPANIPPGETAVVTIAFTNLGTQTWPAGALRLDADGPAAGATSLLWHDDWDTDQTARTVDADVPPGTIASFQFEVRVPADASEIAAFCPECVPQDGAPIIHEVFRLVHVDSGPLTCPEPTAAISVYVAGDADVPDPGSNTGGETTGGGSGGTPDNSGATGGGGGTSGASGLVSPISPRASSGGCATGPSPGQGSPLWALLALLFLILTWGRARRAHP